MTGRKTTAAMEIEAVRSESGDLLFVEVKGAREWVYVGEELELGAVGDGLEVDHQHVEIAEPLRPRTQCGRIVSVQ